MTKDKGKEVEFEDALQCVLDLGNDDVEDEEDGKSIDGRQNRATVGEEGDYSKDKHNDDDNDADIEEEGDDDDNDSDNEVELQQEFPMELMEGYSLGIQPRQLFEYRDYEQRYGRKRKAVSDGNSEGLGKMASLENFTGASRDEIMEALSYGTQRKSRKLRHLKKCGRRKGSKSKLSPEITRMLGEATVHHVHGRHQEAIAILNEVVRQAPHVSDSYHTLAMAHSSLGNTKKALAFYTIAARLKPKDSSLWKVLFTMHMEEGDIARAKMCMAKAVAADPNDETLRSYEVLLNIKLEKYEEAAASCEHIYRISPEKVDALIAASELYLKCGDLARSVKLLEEHLKDHLAEADSSVILQMVTIFMEAKEYSRALQTIEDFHKLHYPGKEIPVLLKIKAGICHVQLGNISNGENLFSVLQHENTSDHVELIVEVADAFMSVKYFHAALKYYHMVDFEFDNDGSLLLKIAHCYLYLEERVKAIEFFYKALCKRKGSANIRLALASLLLEDKREDEVVPLLSPPENPDVADPKPDKKPWWVDGKIKLKLSLIYRNKGMLEEFANTILPLARESMYLKTFKQKVKRRRLTTSVLRERIKILDVKDAGDIFGGVRPLASKLDLMKANRARKLLQKKEEERALAKAAGIDWQSDDSDDEPLKENSRDPPLPNFLEYEEDYDLIIDLCKALQSLERYWEALEIINLTRRLANNKLAAEKDEELQSLASQISCKTTDPKYSFDYVRSNVLQYPHSVAAWNYYYKITSRLGKSYNRHAKFLRYMKVKHKDCVPPVLIAGHQFTMGSFHQDATREYLEAYKLSPESPLVNLCVGTSLINLALGFRLQNKHQCVVQAMAFLYNNLRLSENSQEALYNIARAYHHIGLVSLAVMYYEKVLEIYEKDNPIPKLLNEHSDSEKVTQSGYCDLRREAAYNLHLIYKRSGAVDLARQVLKDHCTL